MRSICLHDKQSIERALRENVYLHLYGIGDLDDFFWPHTIWYSTRDEIERRPVALLYFGQSMPTLLALSSSSDEMCLLLISVTHLMPQRFYAHLSPGVEAAFSTTRHLEARGDHMKMALLNRSVVESFDCQGTVALGPGDLKEVDEFYVRCYPGNCFDPRMLETGQYFGIRDGGRLLSVAGIHVYSRRYGVAALGNIATDPSHRNKGYGRLVTARTCQSLLREVPHVGLNVKADNASAISCYKRLGFETIARYGEYVVTTR